ncbi:hypothetical protein GCM10010420_10170 [Streptomyces glaucosporus]|uniref:Lipoprotein n=2 Tax=Streptomyces glaucosporus TaxID=284044 RepID=A0ABN3HV42_9ACTN
MRTLRARAAALAVPPASCLACLSLLSACSTGSDTPVDGGPPESVESAAAPSFSPHPEPEGREEREERWRLGQAGPNGETPWPPSPGPKAVRDAFAGLQDTLDDSCDTPGNCEYLPNRVLDELADPDEAMKADAKGPGRFPEPIAWMAALREDAGDDPSYQHLKAHQEEIFGTRDRINVWMQDHPDDYRWRARRARSPGGAPPGDRGGRGEEPQERNGPRTS